MIRPVSEYVLREGLCDAVEAVNGANSHAENMDACAAAKRYGLIEAGGSDAHAPGAVGRAWSEISRRVETAAELAEAIRDGRVRPAPPCP
jgi:predicted metal-dependent phosphoesterase TrpH